MGELIHKSLSCIVGAIRDINILLNRVLTSGAVLFLYPEDKVLPMSIVFVVESIL